MNISSFYCWHKVNYTCYKINYVAVSKNFLYNFKFLSNIKYSITQTCNLNPDLWVNIYGTIMSLLRSYSYICICAMVSLTHISNVSALCFLNDTNEEIKNTSEQGPLPNRYWLSCNQNRNRDLVFNVLLFPNDF